MNNHAYTQVSTKMTDILSIKFGQIDTQFAEKL